MQIGVKIFPEDLKYAKKIARYADFFEVMAIPKSDFASLKVLNRPFTIHAIHSRWGFNPANPKRNEINVIGAETAAGAADILGADDIVVHPGSIENRQCSTAHAVKFLRRLDDRFIIENLPGNGADGKRLGSSHWQLRSLLKKTHKGLCLDFAHAAEYAHQKNKDYISFIKKLITLKPHYFHISDTRLQTGRDLHLHLKEGNLKLLYLKTLVPEGSRIAIETNHEFMKQHRDIMLLRQNTGLD